MLNTTTVGKGGSELGPGSGMGGGSAGAAAGCGAGVAAARNGALFDMMGGRRRGYHWNLRQTGWGFELDYTRRVFVMLLGMSACLPMSACQATMEKLLKRIELEGEKNEEKRERQGNSGGEGSSS